MPRIALLRDPRALPDALAHPVIAIGNFDGLHRGHRAVIDRTLAFAKRLSRPSAILSFEPHPRDFFRKGEPVFRLTPLPEKTVITERLGLDALIVLSFDAAMAKMEAEAFIAEWLVRRLGISAVIVGTDFHFGARRLGTSAMLEREGQRLSFDVEILPEVAAIGAGRVSSSAVRRALEAGELGFPTANLRLDASCRLRHGIYAVRAMIEGNIHEGVASFGRRPTFDNGAPLLEVFVFDFAGDLYGKSLNVEFVSFIRPEAKFDGVEALIAKMHEDVAVAKRDLGEAERGPDASLFETQAA
jgi:riboflavin kinase/FMN adenylyltransferase